MLSPIKVIPYCAKLPHACAPYPRHPLYPRSILFHQEASPIRHRRYPPHPKNSLPVASRVGRDSLLNGHFLMVFAAIAPMLRKRSQALTLSSLHGHVAAGAIFD